MQGLPDNFEKFTNRKVLHRDNVKGKKHLQFRSKRREKRSVTCR